MKNLTLDNIAKACRSKVIIPKMNGRIGDITATAVEIDSRRIIKDSVFIATKGERVDGHSFIKDVYEKGALGVVCEKAPTDCDIPYILVEDSFKALKDIAQFYRDQLTIPIIGISGSVGKTSTKEFIAGTLSAKFNVCKTQGNLNNEIGMPLTILSIRDEHDIAVVEMGISDFGEMSRLAAISKPDTCVITNIGECHLENLGDRDGVLRAKTEMFNYMNHDGGIFLNGDDDKLSTLEKPWNREITFFGMKKENHIHPVNVVNRGLLGSDAQIEITGNKTINVHIPLPGKHMVYNAMAAIGIAVQYGLSEEEIIKGVESIEATSGRSHVINNSNFTVIDDCYNANPVSVKAAIDLLCMANTRKVAVLGDMFELGENENALHEGVGAYAAQKGIDVLICIGALSENTYNGALQSHEGNCIQLHKFATKEEAIASFEHILHKGDSVLLKASHGMHFEKVLEYFTEA